MPRVKPRSNFDIFTIGLCFLALFVAQISGSQRGYVCECGGEPVQTQISYCYGPHSSNCHTEVAQNDCSQSEQKSDDRKEHEVVKEEVQFSLVKAVPHVIAPQVIITMLPQIQSILGFVEARVEVLYQFDYGDSPPTGVAVARTIVLLV